MEKFFLLADDDNDDAELFGEALSDIIPPVGFHHAEDGKAVLRFLSSPQNRKPDVIFLDINMPEVTGWQCLVALKKHEEFKDIPVVMYSTSSYSRDKEIAMDLGATGFLTKPSNFQTLRKVLNNISKTNEADLGRVIREMTN